MTEKTQKPARKIVQLAVAQETEWHKDCVFCLADDGTLWSLTCPDGNERWAQLPPIPQDDAP